VSQLSNVSLYDLIGNCIVDGTFVQGGFAAIEKKKTEDRWQIPAKERQRQAEDEKRQAALTALVMELNAIYKIKFTFGRTPNTRGFFTAQETIKIKRNAIHKIESTFGPPNTREFLTAYETIRYVKMGATKLFLGEREWDVLEIKNDRALLIADKCIGTMPYHNSNCCITWAECDLRNYLNKEFYDTSFSAGEKKIIMTVRNRNSNNMIYGTNGGWNTQDKVFLLNIEEVKKYYESNEKRKSDVWWWLRSPGNFNQCAAGVDVDGSIDYSGSIEEYKGGVRPAVWINLIAGQRKQQ